jgi:N-acetylglucosaminyldiphosphoundecaprenol N-acetyl-beta-D-mannosaminyltransferase
MEAALRQDQFMTWPRARVYGYEIDRVSKATLMDWAAGLRQGDRPRRIVTANLNYLTLARTNPELEHMIKSADVVVADAQPLVWAAQALGEPMPERITGHDLVAECLRTAWSRNLSVFFLGGVPGVALKAAEKVRERYAGIRIMAHEGGRFSDKGKAEMHQDLVKMIHEFRPHFLFVALGVPKQDYWLADNLEELGVPFSSGIGQVFDVIAGRLKRAPAWMQKASLEWFYQMQQEPQRLWKRFILGCTPTAVRLAGSVLVERITNGRRPA